MSLSVKKSPKSTSSNRPRYLLLACLSAIAHVAQAQTVLPADAKPTCALSPAEFDAWFVSGKPSLDGTVNPADSIKFANSSECDFYQWSEQMFLWLTSPAPLSYGGGNSMVLMSPVFYNVSGSVNGKRTYTQNQPNAVNPTLPTLNVRAAQTGPNGLQRIFDKSGKVFEVLPAPVAKNGNSLIRDASGTFVEVDRIDAKPGAKPTFFTSANQKIALPKQIKLDPTLAATVAPHLLNLSTVNASNFVQGFQDDNGETVFVDSNGNAIDPTQGQAGSAKAVLVAQNGSLVYYATMVNDVFAFFQTGVANGALPATTSFPTTQAQVTPVVNYAATKGVKIPDQEALIMEIKTSWVETNTLNTGNYITTTASVPIYDTSNPALWIPTGANKSVTLALVGVHVVGSVNGHPEMIWATFEHISNAPNGAYSYTNSNGQTAQVPQSSSGSWVFSSTSSASAAYNLEKANYQAAPNIQATTGNTITASDTIRWKAFGSASDSTFTNPTLENTNVISTNNSVRGQLTGGDIRGNYIMTGATWTIGGAAPGPTTTVGTTMLSNTTMETYDQGTNTTGTGASNCFSCHTTNTTDVSHIYSSMIPLFPN